MCPDSRPASLRHPGDVLDFDEYRSHLPEQWCPMVTIIGTVGTRCDDPHDHFQLRHFEIQTSAYDPSKATSIQFSTICFFETGERWQKVKIPSSGSYVGVTAKIVGRTSDTNFLALRVLDLSYLPRSGSTTTSIPSSTSTPTSKRSSRWDGRVDSSTPSKRMRKSDSRSGSSNGLEKKL
jgi:hypothetical protein